MNRLIHWLRSAIRLMYGIGIVLIISCLFLLLYGYSNFAEEHVLFRVFEEVGITLIWITPVLLLFSFGAWIHRPNNRVSPFWVCISLITLLIGAVGGLILYTIHAQIDVPDPGFFGLAGTVETWRGDVGSAVIMRFQAWALGVIVGAGLILLCCYFKLFPPRVYPLHWGYPEAE